MDLNVMNDVDICKAYQCECYRDEILSFLLERDMALYRDCLKRYRKTWEPDESPQSVLYALHRALLKFDPENGYSSIQYLTYTILSRDIMQEFRNSKNKIKPLSYDMESENGDFNTLDYYVSYDPYPMQDLEMFLNDFTKLLTPREKNIMGFLRKGVKRSEIMYSTGIHQSEISRIVTGMKSRFKSIYVI